MTLQGIKATKKRAVSQIFVKSQRPSQSAMATRHRAMTWHRNRMRARMQHSSSITSVKACCTAPSLNPSMKPQKNKARPKRPQFFLPGLLKVALFPGHWCAWNRRRIDPPKCEKARQCASLHKKAVLDGARHACPRPRSGDRRVRRLAVRRPMWVWRPGPETKRPGGHP